MEPIAQIVNGTTYPAVIVENGITYTIVSPRISVKDYPGKYIYWAPFNVLSFTNEKKMVGVIGHQGEARRRGDDSYYLTTEKGRYKEHLHRDWIPCYVRKINPDIPLSENPSTWLENFMAHFSDLNYLVDLDRKALHLCYDNDVARMRIFLDLTNLRLDRDIIFAVKSVEMLQLFVEKGYNVNTRYYSSSLILHLSENKTGCANDPNRNKIVRYLLSIDPTIINHIDYKGWSCLHHAVFSSNADLCEILLSQQHPPIDINAQQKVNCAVMECNPGTTALHIATYNRNCSDENKKIIQMLVNSGINTELKTFGWCGDNVCETAYEVGSKEDYGLGEYLHQYLYRPPDVPGDISTAGVRYLETYESASSNPLFCKLKE